MILHGGAGVTRKAFAQFFQPPASSVQGVPWFVQDVQCFGSALIN
jgi:hypothetical protein